MRYNANKNNLYWQLTMHPKDFLKSAPGRLIKASQGYWAFIPNPLPPEFAWSAILVNLHSEAERELARLALAGRDFPDPHILVRPFIRNEAVISSRIEGTQSTLEDIYAYEAEQMSFLEPTSDAREVYNYVRALDYGLERIMTLPISLRWIRELHATLLEGVRGEVITPGEFRRSQNWIGPTGCTLETATFVPPPVDEMHVALDALEKFIHTSSDLPTLTRIGLIHYQFEAIHPFLDGNGRVGRLLISLLLSHWGLLPNPFLYLSAYFERNRSEYYERLLAISRVGDWESWIQFFLTGVRDQSREAALRVQALQQLRERYRTQLTGRRSGKALLEVVDFLIGNPIFTVRRLQNTLELSDFKTAGRYVNFFKEVGFVREVTGRKRNRLFRVDEVLKVIQKPLEMG
jgi:Fic family protein